MSLGRFDFGWRCESDSSWPDRIVGGFSNRGNIIPQTSSAPSFHELSFFWIPYRQPTRRIDLWTPWKRRRIFNLYYQISICFTSHYSTHASTLNYFTIHAEISTNSSSLNIPTWNLSEFVFSWFRHHRLDLIANSWWHCSSFLMIQSDHRKHFERSRNFKFLFVTGSPRSDFPLSLFAPCSLYYSFIWTVHVGPRCDPGNRWFLRCFLSR